MIPELCFPAVVWPHNGHTIDGARVRIWAFCIKLVDCHSVALYLSRYWEARGMFDYLMNFYEGERESSDLGVPSQPRVRKVYTREPRPPLPEELGWVGIYVLVKITQEYKTNSSVMLMPPAAGQGGEHVWLPLSVPVTRSCVHMSHDWMIVGCVGL